jgi:hypothetical protein
MEYSVGVKLHEGMVVTDPKLTYIKDNSKNIGSGEASGDFIDVPVSVISMME